MPIGYTKHHPVVFIPGIVSTGLEVWQGDKCAGMFRQRIWGGSQAMVKTLNPWHHHCWLKHMRLNESTWEDPDGIKIRASQGLGSADVFMTGYRLWIDIMASLSDVGYENKALYMASYDWRVHFNLLETRDSYFTNLKNAIELMYTTNDRIKIVVISHSMGSSLYVYFMQWVSAQDPTWVDTYVSSWYVQPNP